MLRNCFISFILLASGFASSNCQIAPDTYWVSFTDKTGTPYSLDEPQKFLSQKAISRRQKQGISIVSSDLPVSPVYLDSLRNLGLVIHNTSKWLNGAAIYSTDTSLLDTLHKNSFIANKISRKHFTPNLKSTREKFLPMPKSDIDYGASENQIKMLNGDALHSLNLNGSGMLIGILDAGFANTRELESISHLWNNNQIIAWKDFVKDGTDLFKAHSHGTIVFSLIGGILPGKIYGTATGANFVLVRTENGSSEYLIEEYNWVSGAEFADSIGVDLINSSLGYSEFDDSTQNHTYTDMDGYTTVISKGAVIAARKGILVVTSAGNSGNSSWHYITAPADADSILAIGAVNPTRIIAGFSGKGPSADGRIKPDVSAQGVSAKGQYINGSISDCNGTSCSSPILAGMSACLWQSRPHATAQQIRQAILQAADRFTFPDTLYGFGIPDFLIAQTILDSIASPKNDFTTINLAPNPVKNYTQLTTLLPWLDKSRIGEITIYDLKGKILSQTSKVFNRGLTIYPIEEATLLEPGYYFVRLAIYGKFYKIPFIKI